MLEEPPAHREKDLEEAILHVQGKLANSGGQAHHTYSCSRVSLDCKPPSQAAQLTLPTSTSISNELGWARYITQERFMMSKPQLQQTAVLVILSDIKANA